MSTQPQQTTLTERQAYEAGQLFLLQVGTNWTIVGEAKDDNRSPLDWAWINPNVPSAICRSCSRVLPVTCFQGGSFLGGSTLKARHPDCVICESRADEEYRQEHMWERRAEAVLRHHMRIERKQGLHDCKSLDEYITLTGVKIGWLARKMQFAWENDESCDHCETAGLAARWREIVPDPHNDYRQLSRMTVDRTDPRRLLARDNLTLMCLPGNIAKNQTDPVTYNDRQAYWRLFNHESAQ